MGNEEETESIIQKNVQVAGKVKGHDIEMIYDEVYANEKGEQPTVTVSGKSAIGLGRTVDLEVTLTEMEAICTTFERIMAEARR